MSGWKASGEPRATVRSCRFESVKGRMKSGGFVPQIITSCHGFRKVLARNAIADRPAILDVEYREEVRLGP
jgi:hypothetical protein